MVSKSSANSPGRLSFRTLQSRRRNDHNLKTTLQVCLQIFLQTNQNIWQGEGKQVTLISWKLLFFALLFCFLSVFEGFSYKYNSLLNEFGEDDYLILSKNWNVWNNAVRGKLKAEEIFYQKPVPNYILCNEWLAEKPKQCYLKQSLGFVLLPKSSTLFPVTE